MALGIVERWIHQTTAAAHKDVANHPAVKNAAITAASWLTPTERICKRIADWTGLPWVFVGSVIFQVGWVLVGQATHMDPFPFTFLLTCSNIVQLELLFIVNVAQRQSIRADEVQAGHDHENISRLLYHQQAQESILLRLAAAQGVDVSDLQATLAKLTLAPEDLH